VPETIIAPAAQITRILIVEDNRDDELLLVRVLKKANLDRHLRVLVDGQQAIDYLDSRPTGVDLVAMFLDLHLPGASGIEVLKKVRESSWLSDLPVYVMSSTPSPDELTRCKELGVSHILAKPITLPIFRKALADVFHRNGVVKEQPERVDIP
jgi:CheY-like chemotaxis protein